MAKNIKIEQIPDVIRKLIPCLIANKDEFEIPSLKSIEGEVKKRVHNRFSSTDGKRRKYKNYPSAYTLRKKTEKGVDNNSGDNVNMILTERTFKDYAVYKDTKGSNSLGFKDDFSRIKVAAEEKRRGDSLYVPNKEEKDRMFKQFNRFIGKQAKICIERKLT